MQLSDIATKQGYSSSIEAVKEPIKKRALFMIELVTKSWVTMQSSFKNDSSQVIHTVITIICLICLVAYFSILNS